MGTKEPSWSSLDDLESKCSSIPLEYDEYPLDLVATVVRTSAPSTCTNSPIHRQRALLHNHGNHTLNLKLKEHLLFANFEENKQYHQGDEKRISKRGLLPQLSLDDMSEIALEFHSVPRQRRPGCCKRCKTNCARNCRQFCSPCLTVDNPLPIDPRCHQKCCYAFMLPPHGGVGHWLTLAVCTLFVYGVFWAITGPTALPGGNFFALILLVVLGHIAGALVKKIKLPPLLGMLLVGCLLKNVPKINVADNIDDNWSASLRTAALVVILLRAGLGLDPDALKKLSWVVLRLAFTPCLIETAAVAVGSHFLLHFPWTWGIMLGFILSAVTPAVVVPSMLSLQSRGYGVDQGVPTLVIAAASVDDVLAITGFTVVLGIIFSEGSVGLTVVRGPLEAVGGIIYGMVFGAVCWYLPEKKHPNVVLLRFVLLLSAGLFAAFGSQAVDCPGAGALGALVLSFMAALHWRHEGWTADKNPVDAALGNFWAILEPLLFGLIGAEIKLSKISGSTVGFAVAVIFLGLAVRMLASFLAVFGAGLNLREKLFIPFAWLPKATVQAAIGSVALSVARRKGAPKETEDLATLVVAIAVLVILITAPLGAIAIAVTGPYLLQKSPRAEEGHKDGELTEVTELTTKTTDSLTDQKLCNSQGNSIQANDENQEV